MNALLLFLHFVGLVMGSGPGLANMLIMRKAMAMSPAEAAPLRQLPRPLAMVSAVGLVLLWVTGLIMVFSVYGGFGGLGLWFWLKMVFVLVITAAIGMMHMTFAQMRRTGDMSLAARLPKIGAVSGVSALLAVFFAVLAFS